VCADTAATALGIGSFAARTAVNAGSSVHLASAELAQKIKRFAADMMEASEQDIVLEEGHAKITGSDVKRSFREIAARAVGMPGFSMAGGPTPGSSDFTLRRTSRPIPTAPTLPRSRSTSRPVT
jgi:carbon-monoxide dehydrogenase large subunit